jgi:hypothetical protein
MSALPDACDKEEMLPRIKRLRTAAFVVGAVAATTPVLMSFAADVGGDR